MEKLSINVPLLKVDLKQTIIFVFSKATSISWSDTELLEAALIRNKINIGPNPLIFCRECDNFLALGALILMEI